MLWDPQIPKVREIGMCSRCAKAAQIVGDVS